MRRMILCGAICLSATVLMAGDNVTPLNVKTGLWETRSTTILSGGLAIPPDVAGRLTPEQRARVEAAMQNMTNGTPKTVTYKSCLTKKQLSEDPFTDKAYGNKVKCQENVVKSTGSDLELKESCTEESANADIHVTFHASDSEHVTGTGNMVATVDGRAANSTIKMESKWLGANCPADVK